MSQAPIESTYIKQFVDRDEPVLFEAASFAALLSNAEGPSADDPCAPMPPRLAELSHELRAAVMAVVGYSEMLLDPQRDAQQDRERIEGIRANGHHLLDLLNSMLDGQPTEPTSTAVELAPCSPWQVVQEVGVSYLPQARQKGLELHITPGDDLPDTVLTDALRLKRILNNLVSNAVKYSETGSIHLDVGLESRCRGGKPLDPVLRIEVSDQGVGIDAEEIKQLARPFYRGRFARERQIEGSGLGLTITRQLVEQLGGQLGVASECGKGTVFRLRLPVDVADEEPNTTLTDSDIEPCPTGCEVKLRGCVLLVEDNPHHQVIIGEYLRQTGLLVEIVAEGEAALAADLRRFDAIILDQHMPRLSGRATAEAMRARGYQGPILSLTADRPLPLEPEAEPFTFALSKAARREEIVALLLHLLPQNEVAAAHCAVSIAEQSPSAAGDQRTLREARFRQLLCKYIQNLAATAKEMREAIHTCERTALRSLAHRMMGSAGLYGFPQLTEAASRLYHATERPESDEPLEPYVQQIETCVALIASDVDQAAHQALRRSLPR